MTLLHILQQSVDTSTPGVYLVKYYLSDSFGTNLKYYRYVTVTDVTVKTTAPVQNIQETQNQSTADTQSTQVTQQNTPTTQNETEQQVTTGINGDPDYTQQFLP